MNKLNTVNTYHDPANYWAPLADEDIEEDRRDHSNNLTRQSQVESQKEKIRRLLRRLFPKQGTSMVLDSGATSHFMTEDLNLLTEGASKKEVFLPNNAKLRTSRRTQLPFDTLTTAASEADILPGLKRSLLSVSKMSKEGYMTIFHPGEEGVTIHKKGTIRLTTSEPPVLKGEKENMAKLWTISATDNSKKLKEVNNVYKQGGGTYEETILKKF